MSNTIYTFLGLFFFFRGREGFFIYLFLAVLGLRFVRGLSLVEASRGHFIAVSGPFAIAASLVVGHRLQMRRLSSCGSQA